MNAVLRELSSRKGLLELLEEDAKGDGKRQKKAFPDSLQSQVAG
jgi:hypothetical protein